MGFFSKIKGFFNSTNNVQIEIENKLDVVPLSKEEQEAVNQLRKDLGVELVSNGRDFLREIIPEKDIESIENSINKKKYSCSKFDIGIPNSRFDGPNYMEGFKPTIPELEDIVKEYDCGCKNYEVDINETDEMLSCTSGFIDSIHMLEFCKNNFTTSSYWYNGSYTYEPHSVECFTAKDFPEKRINAVMDRELNSFLTAMENSDEPKAKEHLFNARAVLVVSNHAKKSWSFVAEKVLKNVVKKQLKSKLDNQVEIDYVFKNIKLGIEAGEKLENLDLKIDKMKKDFCFDELKKVVDFYKKRDKEGLKETLSLSLSGQKEKIEEINILVKEFNFLANKYIDMDKGVNSKTVKIAQRYRRLEGRDNVDIADGR